MRRRNENVMRRTFYFSIPTALNADNRGQDRGSSSHVNITSLFISPFFVCSFPSSRKLLSCEVNCAGMLEKLRLFILDTEPLLQIIRLLMDEIQGSRLRKCLNPLNRTKCLFLPCLLRREIISGRRQLAMKNCHFRKFLLALA
jgi:hypothetical protein